jgi:glycosyltransferase involved in cell wall biosynthesis
LRILHVNKFLYRRGGADCYALDVSALQSKRGDIVEYFGMAHPQNQRCTFEDLFPGEIEFSPTPPSLAGKLKAAGRLLYSPAARRAMEQVLDRFVPDLVHLHNIYHQLSPSILQPLRARGIPAVMTLHDYKLACPTYLFLDHGQVCEACLGGRFHQAILRRCNEGSIVASSLNAIEMTVHTATGAYSPIHLFACPSRFLMGKMTAAGVFVERLRWLPNFVEAEQTPLKENPGGDVVYFGRLSEEKGADIAIDAAARLGARLLIAGDGPARARFEEHARRLGADGISFLGHLPKGELMELVRSASVVVLPSRCHENQPLSVLESFAAGVPVVGTTLGGVPELIEPGVDGELAPPNDASAMADALAGLLENPQRAFRMGRAARAKVESEYSPELHLARLDELYGEAITRARPRQAEAAEPSNR